MLKGVISTTELRQTEWGVAAQVAPAFCFVTLYRECCAGCTEHGHISAYAAIVAKTAATETQPATITLYTVKEVIPQSDTEILEVEWVGLSSQDTPAMKVTILSTENVDDLTTRITLSADKCPETLGTVTFVKEESPTPPTLFISMRNRGYVDRSDLTYTNILEHSFSYDNLANWQDHFASPLINSNGTVIGMTHAVKNRLINRNLMYMAC